MTISVVIATYNGEKYILKQLESLYMQKLRPDEVIICDDLSGDSTVEIVNKYIARKHLEDSWHVYVNEKKLGYSDNFFNAALKATGDYIFFCDQDDVWFENKISEMTAIMEKDKNIGLLCSEYMAFSHGVDAARINIRAPHKMRNDGSLERLGMDKNTISACSEGCTMCFRKSFFDDVKKYRVNRILHNEFIWKLALADDVCYIYHKALLKRRFYAVNAACMKSGESKRQLAFIRRMLAGNERVLLFLRENNKAESKIDFLEKNIEALKLKMELIKDKKLKNAVTLLLNYRQYCS